MAKDNKIQSSRILIRWTLLAILTLIFIPCGQAEIVLGEETDEFDFDGLPGAQHEFKIEVKAGDMECFYQKIKQGGIIYARYEVLRGGDRSAALVLSQPIERGRKMVKKRTNWAAGGGFEWGPMGVTDTYEICLDNRPGKIAKKLVYFYMSTYVEEEARAYKEALENRDVQLESLANRMKNVSRHLTVSRVHVAQSRMNIAKDWYKLKNNKWYVQWWSACQCVVIVVSAVTQVYVLRRLFRNPKQTHVFKTRA